MATVLVIALGLVGIARPDSILVGGLAWLGFLLCVASGWGHLVTRLVRFETPDFGSRAACGIAGYLAVAGPLVALGVCSRPVILLLIGTGVLAFAWREWTTLVPTWHLVRGGARYLRANPAIGSLIVVCALIAIVQLLGAISALDRNPWDDDIAYTPMIRRLLDVGDLVEPFSFRRLSAYGGQTALGALAGVRGSLASVHLVDKGLMFAIALLLIVGYARHRRTQPIWLALIVLTLLLLPDTSINTAAHWSGVAMFVMLYRSVAEEQWSLVGLVGAATCTLRQNYLAVVILFVGIVLVWRLLAARREGGWSEAWRSERSHGGRVIGIAVLTIVGWWIAAFLSSRTFLFPMADGTWNHDLSIGTTGVSWAQQLSFVMWCCIETTPLLLVPVMFALIAFTTDERPGRPLRALFIASTLGFLVVARSFVGAADPSHVWRYAFGFAIALTAMFVIEVGSAEESRPRTSELGRWLLLAMLALQLLVGRSALPKRFAMMAENIREAQVLGEHGDPSARREHQRYSEMQAGIPAGASVAVMLDDPAFLDFARNDIANLDTVGLASPEPQMPAFRGAEAYRTYLVERGYPYVAFVREDHSRYFYRRQFWLWRVFTDGDFFQIMSAYQLDAIDAFAELATTTRVVYDRDGLVVLDLRESLRSASLRASYPDEVTRRSAFTRDVADRAKLHDAWSLSSRADLRFEDGIAALQYIDVDTDDAAWYEIVRPRSDEPLRGTAIRGLYRRAHLRVRGSTDMRLVMRVAISLKTIHTRPHLDISLDGELLTTVLPDDRGRYAVDVVIPRSKLGDGWRDLYLVFGSVVEPEKDLRDLRVSRLEAVEWTPVR